MREVKRLSDKVFNTLSMLKDRMEKAYQIAEEIGEKIGMVSPFKSTIAGAENKINIIIDIDKYLKVKRMVARPGAVLAIIDIVTLEIISVKVVEWLRTDYFSQYGEDEGLLPYTISSDERGLVTRPQVVAKPLLTFKLDNGKLKEIGIADYVIEPRSPVVLPISNYIEELSGIKGDVVLGALTVGEEAVKIGDDFVKVKIPLSDMLYHTFIVGTTGSGKTSFIKNLIRFLLNKSEVAMICIDDNGDYTQTIFDPVWKDISEEERKIEENLAVKLYNGIGGLKEITIILPLTQYFVQNYEIDSFKKLAEIYYKRYLKRLARYSGSKINLEFSEEDNAGIIKIDNREIRVIPYALRFEKIRDEIASIYPFFTSLAREGISTLINFIKENMGQEITVKKGETQAIIKIEKGETLRKYLSNIDNIININFYWLLNVLKIHKGTFENMVRGLSRLSEMGIFDVKIGSYPIEEIDVEEFVKESHLIVFDLHGLETSTGILLNAKRVLTFRFLNKILSWKMKREFEETPITLILIDEAHRFFPGRGVEEREYIEYVSNVLERIARLGRVRGIGLLLSTHSPRDVHDIVLNLCNTKVFFRLDPSAIGNLDIPREYKDFIVRASDRVGVVKSHALRLHYATFKTSLPTLGHFRR